MPNGVTRRPISSEPSGDLWPPKPDYETKPTLAAMQRDATLPAETILSQIFANRPGYNIIRTLPMPPDATSNPNFRPCILPPIPNSNRSADP
jgi:hypothetical protein